MIYKLSIFWDENEDPNEHYCEDADAALLVLEQYVRAYWDEFDFNGLGDVFVPTNQGLLIATYFAHVLSESYTIEEIQPWTTKRIEESPLYPM